MPSESDAPIFRCESCQKPLKYHLGLYGTCRQLQEAKALLREIMEDPEKKAKAEAWLKENE